MKHSEYLLDSGVFTGRRFSASKIGLIKPRPGAGLVVGEFDRNTQRIDVAALAKSGGGSPQDFIVEHERDASEIQAEQRLESARHARRAIDRMERIAQPRAVREALLGLLDDGPEKARLQAIDDEIAAKRSDLSSSES